MVRVSYSFKEPTPGFVYLFHSSSTLYFIEFCSNLYCLFLLGVGFICCSFSSNFRYKISFYIWVLSSFLRDAYIAIYFPLRSAIAVSQDFEQSYLHSH